MATTVTGIYRSGRVVLDEVPPAQPDETKVLVTFLPTLPQELTLEQRAELRHRFAAIAEDWDRPEMDVYDAPAR